jgi:hypothetical protein
VQTCLALIQGILLANVTEKKRKLESTVVREAKETSEREENAQPHRGFYLLCRVVSHYLLYGVLLNRASRFDLAQTIPSTGCSVGGMNAFVI